MARSKKGKSPQNNQQKADGFSSLIKTPKIKKNKAKNQNEAQSEANGEMLSQGQKKRRRQQAKKLANQMENQGSASNPLPRTPKKKRKKKQYASFDQAASSSNGVLELDASNQNDDFYIDAKPLNVNNEAQDKKDDILQEQSELFVNGNSMSYSMLVFRHQELEKYRPDSHVVESDQGNLGFFMVTDLGANVC